MSHKNKKAVIIGCGIAGPSLAIALKHVGIDSEIFEASKSTPDFGIMSFTSNAISALKALDVFENFQTNSTPGTYFYKHSGKILKTPNFFQELKKHNLNDGITIFRSHLIQVLKDKTISNGIQINFGKKLVDIKEEPDKIIANFADGTNAEGDFLIGCDGPFSKTRNIILPNSPSPTYTGNIWTGVDLGIYTKFDLVPNAFHMTFGKKAYSGTLTFPDRHTVWWTNVPCSEKNLHKFNDMSAEEWTVKLIELHKDDHPRMVDSIRAGNNKHVRIPLYDIPFLPTWHKSKVCLIGDAAHATSPYVGQGAAMSMEDAVIMAMCLRDIPDMDDAFTKFEKLRKRRTEKIVKTSQQSGKFMTACNPFKQALRNLLLPVTISSSIKKLNWIFSYKLDWSKKIK